MNLSGWKVNVLGAACALLIANLYFIQPIAGLVATEFGLDPAHVGLLTTLPLLGYGTGLLLVAPLGDLVENRRLILAMTATEAAALFALWLVSKPALFFAASFAAGLSASAIQIILPYTSHLVGGSEQGRAVARLVSGTMLGIVLARPASSFVAEALPWRTIYFASACLAALMTVTLAFVLVPRSPVGASGYADLMKSMVHLLGRVEVLRRRAIYHAAMFGTFIAFWTAIPLWLTGPPFGLSQSAIAWVALAGVAGAIAPPLASRIVDAGYERAGTPVAMALAMCAMMLTTLARHGRVAAIVVAAVLLDATVSAHLVFGQRAIYALAPELRGRMNALYIGCFFTGGGAASAVSAWAFAHYGWFGVVALGVALPALSLLYRLTEAPSADVRLSAHTTVGNSRSGKSSTV